MRTRLTRVLFIFFLLSATVLYVMQANSDRVTAEKKAKTAKNGDVVSKNRALVDNKNWVVEFFLNQMITTADMEQMNEQQIQALEEDKKTTKGTKRVCRSGKSPCINGTNMKKEN